MPAASYLRRNDYSTLKFAPYELPVNDIAKTVMAKTQYWNEGASLVKSRYDDAMNLSLSIEGNQEVKRDYMQKAEQMVRSLSSQNLGNPDVQQAGVGIFKNLFADEGVLYDDAYTKHLQKVHSDYYTLLKKDPSKASSTNLGYATEEERAFSHETDRMSAKGYYERRREYTPAYDPSDDISNAMKYCKASSYTQQSPDYGDPKSKGYPHMTGYLHDVTHEDLSSAQVRECFNAGLSMQAKQQINIDGYMAFKDHKDVLAKSYSAYLQTGEDALIAQQSKLNIEMADLAKKTRLKTITPEEAKAYEAYKVTNKEYGDQIDNLTKTRARLQMGDYSPIDKDYAGISGLVYSNMKTSEFGSAYSYHKWKDMATQDLVQLLHIKQEYDKGKVGNEHEFQFTLERQKQLGREALERLKASFKETDLYYLNPANLHPVDPFVGDKDDTPVKGQHDVFLAEHAEVERQKKVADSVLIAELNKDKEFGTFLKDKKAYNPHNDPQLANKTLGELTPSQLVSQPDFHSWLVKAKKNINYPGYKQIVEWYSKTVDISRATDLLDSRAKILNAQIDPSLTNDSYVDNIKHVVDVNGTTITARDMFEALNGRGSKIQISKKEPRELNRYYSFGQEPKSVYTYVIDGKIIPETDNIVYKLDELSGIITNADGERGQKLKDRQDELYSNQSWHNTHFFNVDKQYKPLTKQLDDLIKSGTASGDKIPGESTQLRMDLSGGVVVKIPGFSNTNGANKSTISQVTGATVSKPIGEVDDDVFLLNGYSGMDYSKVLGISKSDLMLGRSLLYTAKKAAELSTPYGTVMSIPYPIEWGGEMHDYHIEINKSADAGGNPMIEYILTNTDGVEVPITTDGSRITDPFVIIKFGQKNLKHN